MMSPQTKKQKTEETLIVHGEDDVPLPVSSPPMINNSPRQISNQESRSSIQAMAAVNEHDNRVENGASQTRHEEDSSTNGNQESNVLARNVTPETKQEDPRNDDKKQEPKPKPSWFTLIGGHALAFDDAEYIEDEDYPAYGITISVSEDGSEVDVRNPTYLTKY